MNTPGVHIHTWRSEYVVPREHMAAEETRLALDAVARLLPDELGAGLAPWLSSQDDRVLLLHRVDVDCELDVTRDSRMLASRWAYAFARALMHASDVADAGVLRFASPAAFRAQFVSDLTAGQAWHLWYYRAFDGLRALSASNAIRTLLLENPVLGRDTLLSLSRPAWDRLASCMTRADVVRLLDGLSDEAGDPDEAVLTGLLASIDHEAPAAAPWFVLALRAYADALRGGSKPTRALAAFARIAGLIRSLSSDAAAGPIARGLAAGDLAGLAAIDGDAVAAIWPELEARPAWRSRVTAALRRAAKRQVRPEPASEPDRTTRAGGLILLLPDIDALLSDDVCAALPPSADGDRRAFAAWLALAACAGGAGSAGLLREAFWRDLLGIPPAVSFNTLWRWLDGSAPAGALARLADEAGTRVRGRPVLAPLTVDGRRHRILIDTPSHMWVRVDDGHDDAGGAPWRDRLDAARAARADWQYLSRSWDLPAGWDLFFMQLAQIALRRFAYRIPGFCGSSLRHLQANFLSAGGRWEKRSGRVHLSRPPLHTILQITGIARGAIRWSGPPSVDLDVAFER